MNRYLFVSGRNSITHRLSPRRTCIAISVVAREFVDWRIPHIMLLDKPPVQAYLQQAGW